MKMTSPKIGGGAHLSPGCGRMMVVEWGPVLGFHVPMCHAIVDGNEDGKTHTTQKTKGSNVGDVDSGRQRSNQYGTVSHRLRPHQAYIARQSARMGLLTSTRPATPEVCAGTTRLVVPT